MATSGELSETVAKVFCLPKATASNCYRDLRENGAVPVSGRGPNAGAAVTAYTAAKLLIGLAGARYDREPAHKIVADFEPLRAHSAEYRAYFMRDGAETDTCFRLDGIQLGVLGALGEKHSFESALAMLIQASADGVLPYERSGQYGHLNKVRIDVDITSAPWRHADIKLWYFSTEGKVTSCEIHYREPEKHYDSHEEFSKATTACDFRISRTFQQKTIIAVAELIRGAPLLDD